jgi:hypothetical protein
MKTEFFILNFKTTEDSLFLLIKSLHPAEKRYYRLFSGRQLQHRHTKSYQLFRYLDARKQYDEAKTKEALAGIIPAKDFAVHKNHLYNDLLRALQAYHYERTPAMQVRSGLDKAELLHLRGANAQALKQLLRTKKLALELGQQTSVPEILSWERKLLRTTKPESMRTHLELHDAELEQQMALLQEEMHTLRIYDRLFALLQVERRMEKRKLRSVISGISAELKAFNPTAASTFNTWSAYLNAKILLHQIKGEFDSMFETSTELLGRWEQNEGMRKAEPLRFMRVKAQWLNSALASGNIGSHLEKVRKLRKGPPATSPEEARLVFQSLNLELLWLMQKGSLKEAVAFIKTFLIAMGHLEPLLTEVHIRAFQINCAEVHFRAGHHHDALKWLTPVSTGSNQARDTTTFRFSLLLGIACHLEVDNLSVAESQLALLGRRLRDEDADWEFGHLVAPWLRKLHRAWGTADAKKLSRDFAVAIQNYAKGRDSVTRIADLLAQWCER